MFQLTCLGVGVALSAGAQTYRIHDGGMTRTFTAEERPAAVAAAAKGSPTTEPQIILYEAGVEKNEYTKRMVTKQVLLKAANRAEAEQLAKKHGAKVTAAPDYAPGFYVLETTTYQGALDLADTLQAEPLLARQQQKKMIPNDPMFTNQWHLLNTGQSGATAGIDIHVTNVWDSCQGSNILIGIVDDGLLTTHQDLSANVNTSLDWDFDDNDNNPSPGPNDTHGTPCAGIAAARGNNGIGISGAAPRATLVGFRLVSGPTTDGQEAAALSTNNALIHIKSNSWGPDDEVTTLEGPGKLTAGALKTGAETGRSGKGNLFFWAGGNGLEALDNANYDGYANSIYTIAIGAVGEHGTQAYYSEPGACLVVCAPGGDGIGLTTTTSTNGYKSTFAGTSAAAPLAAGVGALILNANTNLGWRDVQEILMKSARKNDPSDGDWTTNAAGFHFNHKYGAGMIDAQSAVALSTNWITLGAHTNFALSHTGVNLAIPDDNPAGVTNIFSISRNFRVEHVTLTVDIDHEFRGDVALELISPSGTVSRLAEDHNDDTAGPFTWNYSTVRNWGENSEGNWIVHIHDTFAGDTGTVNSLTLTLYGSDADSMDDAWENANFGNTITVNDASDYDGDGFSDYDEWRAGTQPTNVASKLAITTVQPGTNGSIGWQSVSGKIYTVQYTTNLLENFQTLETNLAANPPQNLFTNLPAGAQGYFRILLESN